MNSGSDHKACITIEETLYYAMFSLLLCLKGIGLEEGSVLFRTGLGLAAILFTAKILIGKYSIKELAVIAAGIAWGIFAFLHVGSLSILIYALMVMGMKNVSVSRVMKVGAVVWGSCFLATITAALFLNRAGVQLVHEKLGLGPVLRESLGYSHPNVLHVTYIVLMAFVLYVCKKKAVWKTITLLLVGDVLVFMYSMSYTGLLISLGLVIVYLYFIYRCQITIGERIAVVSVLPLCVLMSILPVALDPQSGIYRILNSALNNRAWAIKLFFDVYPQTILGQRIIRDNFSLDNSYIYALAWYGIAYLLMIICCYTILIWKCLKQNRRKELAIIISFLIAGITEQFLFNTSIKNITFVFMGEMLFEMLWQKERELNLLSKWNGTLSPLMELNWKQRWSKTWKRIPWKRITVQYIVVYMCVLTAIFFIKTTPYKAVYVNERICDCGGTLVSWEQINESDDILILGNKTDEDQFYYFTNENSNFITVMDGRYKISLSIYISAVVLLGIQLLEAIKRCWGGKR